MKRILIVEDDGFKAQSLRTFVYDLLKTDNITLVSSLAEAITTINEIAFDYILVDMAIPSHPIEIGEGSPISLLSGGIEILLELNFLGRKDKCIIITQYPEIEICEEFVPIRDAVTTIKKLLDVQIDACIEYIHGSEDWKKNLSIAFR